MNPHRPPDFALPEDEIVKKDGNAGTIIAALAVILIVGVGITVIALSPPSREKRLENRR